MLRTATLASPRFIFEIKFNENSSEGHTIVWHKNLYCNISEIFKCQFCQKDAAYSPHDAQGLLGMIALSDVQSSTLTPIHNAIFIIAGSLESANWSILAARDLF